MSTAGNTESAAFIYPQKERRMNLNLKDATPNNLKKALDLPGYPSCLVKKELNKADMAIFFDEDGINSLCSALEPNGEYEVKVPDTSEAINQSISGTTVETSKPENLGPKNLDIQRALVCSQAVYEKTPKAVQEFLKKDLRSHDFININVSRHGCPSYMVAETKDNDAFIAFRGTSNFEDVMADCSIWQQLASYGPDGRQTAMGGRCHAGFLKLASSIPVDPFLMKYQHNRIVLCGHSLGGAVSHIVALNMLVELKRRGLPTDNIMSIAFGAPFFGDEGLRAYVEKENLSNCLLTVVNQNDPVPRILRLAEAIQSAGMAISDIQSASMAIPDIESAGMAAISDKVKKFFKAAWPQLKTLLRILSSTEIGGPTVASIASSILDISDNLAMATQEHNIEMEMLNSLYRPVGWYLFITSLTGEETKWVETYVKEEGKITSLMSNIGKFTLEQVQEHKIVRYATSFFNTSGKHNYDVECDTRTKKSIPRKVSKTGIFPLRVDRISGICVAPTELYRTHQPNSEGTKRRRLSLPEHSEQAANRGGGKLLVKINGKYLDFFVPSEDPFKGIPYDKTSVKVFKSSTQVSLECYLTDGMFSSAPRITVRTHFQEFNRLIPNIKEVSGCKLGQLAVAKLKPELLYKATQRCLAMLMMMPKSNQQAELERNPMMTYLDKLDKSRRAVRNNEKKPELRNMVENALSGGLAELQDKKLLPVVGEIVTDVGNHLELIYPKRWHYWILESLLGLATVAGVALTGGASVAYFGGIAVSLSGGQAIAGGFAGLLATGGSLYGKKNLDEYFIDVEHNYQGVLRILLEELPSVKDASIEKSICDMALPGDVYSLESAVKAKYEKLGFIDKEINTIIASEDFKSSWGEKLARATEESQKEALRRCQMTCDLFRIRQLLIKTCFVGLIGPQNTGKSTLIKMLWGMDVKNIGFQKHTETAELYKARGTERMMIVDFPGTTMVKAQAAELVNNCGGLASFFILVMTFNGDPSKTDIDQVKKVKTIGCSFVICINQCGRFLKDDVFKTKKNTDHFRAKFSKELDVKPSDIFFTDFKKCTPAMRAVGLVGVDDMRQWIKEWLVTYDVFEKDEPELSSAVNEQTSVKGTEGTK